MSISLCDMDIVVYRAAASAELDSYATAVDRFEYQMAKIVECTKASLVKSYITGENNFRYKIYPEYKANRRDTKPPRWRQELNEHAVVEWKSEVTDGFEADDALGIEQVRLASIGEASVICSIDKDLKQIPGYHYNFVKDEFDEVLPDDGLRFFYQQLLMGDRADNVFGIPGIGPKKSEAALAGWSEVEEWFTVVREYYNDDARMLMNARCMWIWQRENDDWVNTRLGQMLQDAVDLKTA